MPRINRAALFHLVLARGPQLALLAIAAVLIARTEGYFSPRNLSNIVNLAGIVGVLAVGQAFAIVGGGFDLAQGATLALAAAVAARLIGLHGWPPWAAALMALATGLGVGLAHGLCVGYARTSAFVTTLSSSMIVRGLTFLLLAGQQFATPAFEPLADPIRWGGLRLSGLSGAFLAATLAGWILLRYTVLGQHIYATGGNAQASRLAGVRTRRVILATFLASGLAAAAAGLLWLAFTSVAKADSGQGYELKAIAACVIGGISLQGGRGSVLGAALGCLLLQALSNLIGLGPTSDEYSTLVTGAVILVFALTDALARQEDRR
jgi:ribose transport system permease protein